MNTQNVHCSVGERASFIKKRISEKIEDYDKYAFTKYQDCALKTFFDLARAHPETKKWAQCSFQFRNEQFFAKSRKSRSWAEVYM